MEPLLIFQQQLHAGERPAGIIGIAAIFFAYAVVSAAYALLIAGGRIALARGAWIVGGGLETLGPGIFLLCAIVYFASAVGLWRLHRWGLRVSSLLLVYGIVQVTPAISSAVGDGRLLAVAREGAQILWRSAALWYIWQEPTRDAFRPPST